MSSMPTNKQRTTPSPRLSPFTNTNTSTTTVQFLVVWCIAAQKFPLLEPGTSFRTIARAKYKHCVLTSSVRIVEWLTLDLSKDQLGSWPMLKVKSGSCRRMASSCQSLLTKNLCLPTLAHEHALQGVIVLNTVPSAKYDCFKRHLRHANRHLSFTFNTFGESTQQSATTN